MSGEAKVPGPPVALSTSSVYPERTPDAFEMAARLGYDGVEVMVYTDPVSQDADVLRRLSDYHQVPILSVHAPSLLLTQRVWGREPWEKLRRAKDLAERRRRPGGGGAPAVPLAARVRPRLREGPGGRWPRKPTSSSRWRTCTRCGPAAARWCPTPRTGIPTALDVPHVTLDLSHTAASGSDALVMAAELGGRLAHVHLADGTGNPAGPVPDEHLVPGRGSQPCAELLGRLTATGYHGVVVVEVKTNRAPTREDRVADLAESLAFARKHLALPRARPAGG